MPSGNHLEPSLEIIEAGKHLIIEKPLEISLERCDAIIEASRKKGVKLTTIFSSRFYEVFGVVKSALNSGRFGGHVLGDAYVKWYHS